MDQESANERPQKEPRRRQSLTEEEARPAALRRLSAREYSAEEMRQYLERRGLAVEAAERVVRQLCEDGYIDDRRYQRTITRVQLIRDKGPMAIVMKLKQKGISLELSEARKISDEESGQEEADRIRQVLEKRYPRAATDRVEAGRAYQGLARRGFSPSLIRDVLRKLGQSSLPDTE